MTGHGSALHIAPPARYLAPLFELARLLTRHPDLDLAMDPFLEKISRTTGSVRSIAALAEADIPGPRVVAVSSVSDAGLVGVPLRMGTWPGGQALSRGGTALSRAPDGNRWIEVPCKTADSVTGMLCFSLSESSLLPESEYVQFIEWCAVLLTDSISLRNRISSVASRACLDEDVAGRMIPGNRMLLKDQGESGYSGIIGRSDPMMEVFDLIDRVAPIDTTVLITGESGTGKELVARAIHDRGRQSTGPFIAVNCAALPESVVESELFGHEKGSFTGAFAQRKGRFELASGGTLFLDEIGELSPAVQVKLLRILQERSFERVGGAQTIETNARIVVATNRNLEKEVSEGRFREDLYFRLNIFPIRMPPLRERGSDILLLADSFAARLGEKAGKPIVRISSPAIDLLVMYHWPGNVRELENCIERAVIMSSDGVIHAYNLPPSLQSAESTGTGPTTTLDGALARIEKELVLEALKMEKGNAAQAARRLGVTERRMGLALRRFGVDWRRFRTKK